MNGITFTYDISGYKKIPSQDKNLPSSAIIIEKTDSITARELENIKTPSKSPEHEKKKENR